MNRRSFLALAGAAAAFPRVALAQAKVPRVVYFGPTVTPQYVDAFKRGLSDGGYVDGTNIAVEVSVAGSNTALPDAVAKVVASKPDVIYTPTSAAALAAKAATTSIPIVFLLADPIAIGLVTSLAHP